MVSIRLKYFLIGAAFGMLFPVGAFFFEIAHLDLPMRWSSVSLIHEKVPLVYMVDSAPLFLGFFAFLGLATVFLL